MSLRRISAIPFVLPHIIKAAHLRDSVDKRHVLHDRYTGIHWIISFFKRRLGFSSSDPLGWTRIEDMPYGLSRACTLDTRNFAQTVIRDAYMLQIWKYNIVGLLLKYCDPDIIFWHYAILAMMILVSWCCDSVWFEQS